MRPLEVQAVSGSTDLADFLANLATDSHNIIFNLMLTSLIASLVAEDPNYATFIHGVQNY